jgi:hypothetical protein
MGTVIAPSAIGAVSRYVSPRRWLWFQDTDQRILGDDKCGEPYRCRAQVPSILCQH